MKKILRTIQVISAIGVIQYWIGESSNPELSRIISLVSVIIFILVGVINYFLERKEKKNEKN